MAQGRFRRDLYERLNYVPVRVPPLRERVEDLPLLLRHALDQNEAGRWIELSSEAEQVPCASSTSRGRATCAIIEQLAARLSLERRERAPVTPRRNAGRWLRARSHGAAAPRPRSLDLSSGLPSLLEEAERSWLEQALRAYPDATRAELAARLKISESALYKKLRQYGLAKG